MYVTDNRVGSQQSYKVMVSRRITEYKLKLERLGTTLNWIVSITFTYLQISLVRLLF